MESRTKNKQTVKKIQEMAIRAFGRENVLEESGVIKELKEGFFNAAYQITLKDGKEAILKIAPPNDAEIMSYERNIMKTEVEMMRLIKEQTNVPVPEVYYYDKSRSICEAEYYFMEKLEGVSYFSIKEELSQEVRKEIELQIGVYNRAINELMGKYYGYPGQKELQGESWDYIFGKMVEGVLKDGERKQVDLGIPYDEIRNLVQGHKALLKSVNTPHLVHWDLWDGNVLVKEGKITGIIDFERALWGDVLMEHYFKDITDKSERTAFLDGYGITSFKEEDIKKRSLYNIHLYLIMVIECAYREYEDDGQYMWAKKRLNKMIEYLK